MYPNTVVLCYIKASIGYPNREVYIKAPVGYPNTEVYTRHRLGTQTLRFIQCSRLAPVLKTFILQFVISYTCSYSLILIALF